jgi:hypothetical protein
VTTTFGVIGAWGEFFPRLARGVRTFRTAEELLAAGPNDVIVSVPWTVGPAAMRELVGLGTRIGESAKSGRDVTTEREAWAR